MVISSAEVENFSGLLKLRLMGSDNRRESKIIFNTKPRKKFVTGILFPRYIAEGNLNPEYKTKISPFSILTEFEVAAGPCKISVSPSFWIFPVLIGERVPVGEELEEMADIYDENSIWSGWTEINRTPSGTISDDEGEEQESRTQVYIRKRFSESFDVDLDTENGQRLVQLGLTSFSDAMKRAGLKTSKWSGALEIKWITSGAKKKISVSLINSVDKTTHYEPCWFDVRMKVQCSANLLKIECPEISDFVFVKTENCVSTVADNNTFLTEQIGSTFTKKKDPIKADKFSAYANESKKAVAKTLEAIKSLRLSGDLYAAIEEGGKILLEDANAAKAFEIVSRTLDGAISEGTESGSWRLHQLASLFLCIRQYMTKKSRLESVVLNLPTATGKTEAFISAILWAAAYEKMRGNKSINIVKYPTRMLGLDQTSRIAKYCMVFDSVMESSGYSPLGFGYFAGKSLQSKDPQQIIKGCPLCSKPWSSSSAMNAGGYVLTCNSHHKLYAMIDDDVLKNIPAIILSTLDKYVARSYNFRLGNILGGNFYYCEQHGISNKPLETNCPTCGAQMKLENKRPGFLVLDEAHLIREDDGTRDSHFETLHSSLAKINTDNNFTHIISTATIKGIENHAKNLGIESSIIFPGEDLGKFFVETPETRHAILAIEPSDRTIDFAMGLVAREYFSLLEEKGFSLNPLSTDHDLYQISSLFFYFPSYRTLEQVHETLNNQVNSERERMGRRKLHISQIRGDTLTQEELTQKINDIKDRKIDVILSTKIASVGIDVQNLNSVCFYGVPTSISEFIQTINRTARRSPGVAVILLDPSKERDRSYYTYFDVFIRHLNKCIEEIPLNRFARNAIDETFWNIAISLLLFYYMPKNKRDYRRRGEFIQDINSGKLDKSDIISKLKKIYRAEEDPSKMYARKVQELWTQFERRVRNSHEFYIWKVFEQPSGPKLLYSLRAIEEKIQEIPERSVQIAEENRVLLHHEDEVESDE